jgi:hypothetical protein
MTKSESPLVDITGYSPDALADKIGAPLARALYRIFMNKDEGTYRGFSNCI